MSLSLSPIFGALTALVTPFDATGETVDVAAFEALVERQILAGVSGLVPCGTTGEAPTLTETESSDLIARTVQVARGRVPVFAGTGTFSTRSTIQASQQALKMGATGVMVVMPYYSKPSQEGLYQHIVTIARAIEAPVILYNIPGRTRSDLSVETTELICEAVANVVALKDATGHVLRCQELTRRLGDRLTILCGDDALTIPMMAVGARGVISVTSNVYPESVVRVVTAAREGEWDEARRAHLQLLPVHEAMFCEPNPGPIKAALAWKYSMNASVRLPLVPLPPATLARLHTTLTSFETSQ